MLLLNTWTVGHLAIAIMVAVFVDFCLKEAANTLLMPLAGVLVGLTFAWAGNALTILQTKEIEAMAKKHPQGMTVYIYTYQLAVFMLLVTLCAWGLAGLGAFEQVESILIYSFIKVFLIFLASLSVRECWGVVMLTQMLILSRDTIRQK